MPSPFRTSLSLVLTLLLTCPSWAAPASDWPSAEMPLQVTVRTPQDTAFKAAAERQYLIFSLLAGGRFAYDKGDMGTAATRWEQLLRVPGLPLELEAVVKPLAVEARSKVGGSVAVELPMPPPPRGYSLIRPRLSPTGTVEGTVQGGAAGAAGAVVWLTRAQGPTPKPKPASRQVVLQKAKRFLPHVLVVPAGTEVGFLNEDQMLHNVFSLSRPNEFDLGLYEKGVARAKVFSEPGPVRLLCNIHASMSAFVYVVDSPWYTQADAQGHFTLRGVPPGDYVLHSWHETSARPSTQPLTVVGTEPVSVVATVTGDAEREAFVPDKSGHPRQSQLGY